VTQIPDDRLLTQYLLRSLSEEETERLDELSIADDDFSARLSSAENDLVDAYVRGELPPEQAARFKSAYLSSAKRREKVNFAETLLSFQQRTANKPVVARAAQTEKRESVWTRLFGPLFGTSRSSGAWLAPQWGLAAAALLLFIASGYLLNTNRELRQQVSRSESNRAILAQQQQQLQQQLASRTATAGTQTQTQAPASLSLDHLKVATFMLGPSLRGAGSLPTVRWSSGTDLVVLQLQLESTEFSTYRVAIEDAATRQVAWESTDLKPAAERDKQALSCVFPPSLLQSRNYMAQIKGIRANGREELVGSYPFHGVIE
jgi:hypothetical protein